MGMGEYSDPKRKCCCLIWVLKTRCTAQSAKDMTWWLECVFLSRVFAKVTKGSIRLKTSKPPGNRQVILALNEINDPNGEQDKEIFIGWLETVKIAFQTIKTQTNCPSQEGKCLGLAQALSRCGNAPENRRQLGSRFPAHCWPGGEVTPRSQGWW